MLDIGVGRPAAEVGRNMRKLAHTARPGSEEKDVSAAGLISNPVMNHLVGL